jgi:hypothetical protein
MNLRSKFAALAILAGFLLGTINVSAVAFAEKQEDPDCWGEESAEQAKTGEQGEHASDPDPSDEDHETPRSGIGNIGEDADLTPGSKHPSDLGEALNTGDCEPN